jgi:ribosomal protein S6
MKAKRHLTTIASAALLASTGAFAAGNTAATTPAPAAAERPIAPGGASVDPTQRDAAVNSESDQLEQKLRAGQNRADYKNILESNGYRIAAINRDKKDYLEYEVVKGNRSYEVQLDFKDGATRATEIDVAANMWRADATERMLKDANYSHTGPLVADRDGRYSDSRYMKAWTDEKDRLEKALPPNLKVSEYKSKIESMGYKVTAVNDRDRGHLEYEIAKGDNSYEVKIDVDPASQIAKDVDVTSNLWEADPTDRATDRPNARRN